MFGHIFQDFKAVTSLSSCLMVSDGKTSVDYKKLFFEILFFVFQNACDYFHKLEKNECTKTKREMSFIVCNTFP